MEKNKKPCPILLGKAIKGKRKEKNLVTNPNNPKKERENNLVTKPNPTKSI